MENNLWCFLRLLYYLFIEVIFEGSCFEFKKLVFEMKHACNFQQ
jgi:hypothetical protein